MSIITDRDRNQLSEIIAIVKPVNSLAERLDALTNEQRFAYDHYRTRWDQWFARCKFDNAIDCEPDGRPYARAIEGYGPKLRADIAAALFGPLPIIPIGSTDDQDAQIYIDYVKERQ